MHDELIRTSQDVRRVDLRCARCGRLVELRHELGTPLDAGADSGVSVLRVVAEELRQKAGDSDV